MKTPTLPVRAYQYSFIRCDSQTVTLLHHFAPNGAREVTVNHADFCNASDKGYVEPRSLLTASSSHAALVAERDALRAALEDSEGWMREALAEAHRLNVAAGETCFNPAVFQGLGASVVNARKALSAPPALRDGQE